MKDFDFNGELMNVWKGLRGINTTRYIAKTGEELKTYLNAWEILP